MRIFTTLLTACCLALATATFAEVPKKIASALQPFVDSHILAGAVTLVADKDKVLSLETVGYEDIATKKPMRANATFWIASMSKAMTAAGLMVLVDEGKVKLDDPVANYLPEFTAVKLANGQPPAHPPTVRQVLSHSSGLAFKSAAEQPTLDVTPLSERTRSYAATPLVSEPGTQYLYSNAGINTAARMIEVITGKTFEDFMDERLLKPLGMTDTTFWPNDEQVSRLAKSYKPTADKTNIEETPISQLKYPLTDRANRTPMPGGGYFSTAADVAKFCQLLLRLGEWQGKRLLSEEAVKTMTRVQSGQAKQGERLATYGFGLQVITSDNNAADALSQGSYDHGGAYATHMWVDPKKQRVVVFMVQQSGGFPGEDARRSCLRH